MFRCVPLVHIELKTNQFRSETKGRFFVSELERFALAGAKLRSSSRVPGPRGTMSCLWDELIEVSNIEVGPVCSKESMKME